VENCIYTNQSDSRIKKAQIPEVLAGGCLLWFRNEKKWQQTGSE
jgi:hypothetical protein